MAVLNDAIPVAHHLIVGFQEHPLYGFRIKVRRGAFILTLELPIALPDYTAACVCGVSNLLTIKATAIAADQL